MSFNPSEDEIYARCEVLTRVFAFPDEKVKGDDRKKRIDEIRKFVLKQFTHPEIMTNSKFDG